MTFRQLLGSRRRVVWFVVVIVLIFGAGLLTAPRPVHLGSSATGDRALAARTRDAAGDAPYQGLAVAVVDHGHTRTAGPGDTGTGRAVTPGTPFEIGSVTKTLTASLFADLVGSGVVRPDQRVRDVLPARHWRAGGIGDVTLAELAGQRSGLPRLPLTPTTLPRNYGFTLFGMNPYGGTTPDGVIDAAAAASLRTRGRFGYSNLGFAFLGQVLAAKAGTPYPELLRERVLRPAGMTHTVIPRAGAKPPAGRAPGHDAIGRTLAPGTSAGYAPAGSGVWSTAGDLARFGAGVLQGTAPGADAARPRYPADEGDRIGYAWYTSRTHGGGSITWHDGIAGGCAAFLGFDRAHQRVVAVLGNTDTPVDATGVRRPPDRARLLSSVGWSVFLFAVAYAAGPANALGVIAWLAGAVLLGSGAFAAAVQWRRLACNSARRPRWHWAGAAIALIVGIGLAVGVTG